MTSPPPRTINPLVAALDEVQAGNLSTGLDFLLEQVILSNDPARCYQPIVIRSAAAEQGSKVRDAGAKFKLKYGKDFSLPRWNADIKEAKAELTRVDSSSAKLLTSETGTVKPILANAILQLQSSSARLGFDTFSSVVTHLKRSPWGSEGAWRDLDDVSAANYLQHAGVTVASATANEAAFYLAQQKPFHPVRDWLQKLKWDGVPRLEMLAYEYLGCPDSPYGRAVSTSWPMSAVARIMRPGCQVKYMIVLEGPQDQGKSRALRALCNGHMDGDAGVQWFRDSLPDIDKDDIGLYMQGVWIIEIAELSAIRGKQWERVKAFISSQSDTFRRKFGRNMQDYPRQCVFAGSTNEDQWGGDATGLTRFWPLRPGTVDVDAILKDREQLWAEARTLYDEGKPWWLDSETDKLARVEQDQRAPEDTWSERVSKITERLINETFIDDVSISEIQEKMMIPERDRQSTQHLIGRALMGMGWHRFRPRDGGNRVRRYRRPELNGAAGA